jgi:hypothetical protein
MPRMDDSTWPGPNAVLAFKQEVTDLLTSMSEMLWV